MKHSHAARAAAKSTSTRAPVRPAPAAPPPRPNPLEELHASCIIGEDLLGDDALACNASLPQLLMYGLATWEEDPVRSLLLEALQDAALMGDACRAIDDKAPRPRLTVDRVALAFDRLHRQLEVAIELLTRGELR